MSDAFGARLRDWRERRQIPLRTIAENTKIKLSLLEDLERDDLSRWPGGIFRRSFVRAYAQAVGLDVDATVREFVERYPEPEIVLASLLKDPIDEAAGPMARLRATFGLPPRSAPAEPSERSTAAAPAAKMSEAPSRIEPVVLANEADATATEPTTAVADAPPSVPDTPPSLPSVRSFEPDLAAVAQLCVALGCVDDSLELMPLLEETARVLNARGIILWLWDPDALALRATLALGYSDDVLAQLPAVDRDDENATAAAFRLGQPRALKGTGRASAALAVPLMTPVGSGGVLALELCDDAEPGGALQSAATIVAAQFATMLRAPAAAAADRKRA